MYISLCGWLDLIHYDHKFLAMYLCCGILSITKPQLRLPITVNIQHFMVPTFHAPLLLPVATIENLNSYIRLKNSIAIYLINVRYRFIRN